MTLGQMVGSTSSNNVVQGMSRPSSFSSPLLTTSAFAQFDYFASPSSPPLRRAKTTQMTVQRESKQEESTTVYRRSVQGDTSNVNWARPLQSRAPIFGASMQRERRMRQTLPLPSPVTSDDESVKTPRLEDGREWPLSKDGHGLGYDCPTHDALADYLDVSPSTPSRISSPPYTPSSSASSSSPTSSTSSPTIQPKVLESDSPIRPSMHQRRIKRKAVPVIDVEACADLIQHTRSPSTPMTMSSFDSCSTFSLMPATPEQDEAFIHHMEATPSPEGPSSPSPNSKNTLNISRFFRTKQ